MLFVELHLVRTGLSDEEAVAEGRLSGTKQENVAHPMEVDRKKLLMKWVLSETCFNESEEK